MKNFIYTMGQKDNDKTNAIQAIEEGNTKKLQTILGKGLNPNSTDEQGFTLLHLAAYYDRPDMCKMLITQYRADKDSISGFGESRQTPIHLAIRKGNKKVFEILLELDVDLLTTNLLKAAAISNRIDLIEPVFNAIKNKHGNRKAQETFMGKLHEHIMFSPLYKAGDFYNTKKSENRSEKLLTLLKLCDGKYLTEQFIKEFRKLVEEEDLKDKASILQEIDRIIPPRNNKRPSPLGWRESITPPNGKRNSRQNRNRISIQNLIN